jgi:maltose O-acetyltransferase
VHVLDDRPSGTGYLTAAANGHDGAWAVPPNRLGRRALELAREEIGGLDGRALAARVLSAPLPTGVGNRVRAAVLRASGMQVGAGTSVLGAIRVTGGSRASTRLTIGRQCFVNVGCHFDATVGIAIGDRVSIGQHVLMTTSSHDFALAGGRGGPLLHAPIRVEDGAWIAARAVLLPGVTVGQGAVVSAGAVVTRSVPAHTMVGGVPAKPIRDLPT